MGSQRAPISHYGVAYKYRTAWCIHFEAWKPGMSIPFENFHYEADFQHFMLEGTNSFSEKLADDLIL